ncbi:16412_t:CDS:2, partial [Funneliformis geosporum]|uniref:11420_t:CDS:1 n=1 Tax=Funneliformis geosporum TaxID=1117311 RepID=A0A9W4SHQ7_9GLOM
MEHMESVEVQLKELQSFLNDEIIKDFRKSFKELSEMSKNFENYQNIVNYDTKLRQVFDGLINEKLIKNSQELKNPDNSQQFFSSLRILKFLAKKIAYLKRIDIIQDVLNSPHKKNILFYNALTKEEINKRYRNLVLNFHPDKTNRPESRCALLDEHKDLGAELFGCITEIKESLLATYEKIINNEGWKFHKNNADDLWKIAIDYRNAAKGQWNKLKSLKKDNIGGLSSEYLELNSVNYGLQAYQEYRAACKIVDKAKQLRERVRLRGSIALCLYVSKRHLEAQLYALSAIKLQLKDSYEVTINDCNEAKKIFDKVRDMNVTEKTPELKTEINLNVNFDYSQAVVKRVDQEISFSEKSSYQRSIDDDMLKISADLMLKADSSLVCYQIPKEDILQAKYQSWRKTRVGGIIVTGVGITATATAKVIHDTVVLLGVCTVGSTICIPFCLATGLITLGLGIWGGTSLWKKDLMKDPKTLENLNDIMKSALKAYNKGDYQQFINELSKNYKTDTSLLTLRNRSDDSYPKVLSSGKINIKGKVSKDLVSLAKKILVDVNYEKLDEEAEILDGRIRDLRSNNIFNIVLNQVADFISLKGYSNIAKEHKDDAKRMPFKLRLKEMRNIADLNLAIFDIIDGGEEELERAKKTIEEIRDKNYDDKNYDYGFVELRLEVLEDFLMIVCGVELPLRIASIA